MFSHISSSIRAAGCCDERGLIGRPGPPASWRLHGVALSDPPADGDGRSCSYNSPLTFVRTNSPKWRAWTNATSPPASIAGPAISLAASGCRARPAGRGAAMTLPAGSKPRGRGSTRGPPRSPPSAPASAPPSAPPSAPSSRQGRGDAGAAVGRGRQAMLTYGFEFLPLWCAEILFARIGREDVRRPLHWDVDPGLIGGLPAGIAGIAGIPPCGAPHG